MTWRPASARLWRPGQVTAEQREEIERMIAVAIATRQEQTNGQEAPDRRSSEAAEHVH